MRELASSFTAGAHGPDQLTSYGLKIHPSTAKPDPRFTPAAYEAVIGLSRYGSRRCGLIV
jgi:hypothetical protein